MLIPTLPLVFRFDHEFSSYGPKTAILGLKMGFLLINSNVDKKHTLKRIKETFNFESEQRYPQRLIKVKTPQKGQI